MDPLHQFEILPYLRLIVGNFDVSFTNSSLWMLLSVGAAFGIVAMASRSATVVPGRLQSAVEMGYEFIAGILRDNAGKEAMRFFPLIFTMFLFIFMGNMLGMVPGSFTFTSHIIVTFAMAIGVFIFVTLLGIYIHGFKFFSLFVPKGAPALMLPLLVPIEILSYCVRPISLSVRLFCNMMAGHTMMKVFASFVISLGSFYILPGLAPFAVTVLLTGFEFAVAFLQAYIFTVLTCIYLHDAIHLH